MSKPSASELESYLIPTEEWDWSDVPETARKIAREETREGIPAGIARHPTGWYVIVSMGQGPCIIWEDAPPRHIAIRRILLPRDTNHRGEIFGGALLAEIDLAGAVEARRHTSHDVATVAMKEVQFERPVQVGDVVTFYTSLIRVGRTSIHVRVSVESSRDGDPSPDTVTAAELVYVAVKRMPDGSLVKVPVK